uniref:AP-2 complex subunit alpha n=2 Tax=Hirondellea gigas TaxID=1518452 RepID=A0A6A7G4W7_9CRUS
MANIRGLTVFISSIRNCKTQDQEQKKVQKELAKIRAAFGKKRVDGYSKKKYLWKIMYIYMLGYSPNFGHMEAVNLITSTKFSEKQVGYVSLSVLLIEHRDLLRLCIQSFKNDLMSTNEIYQCLALTAIANVAEQEMAESLSSDVQKLLLAPHSRNFVKKKAALCLLRLYRKFPEIIQADSWAPRLIEKLEGNIGVITCVMSLLTEIVKNSQKGYESVVPQVIKLLTKFAITRDCQKDYTYYKTPCPWLQVKLLRILQYFPAPQDPHLKTRLFEILDRIVHKTEITKSVNKNNAEHGLLFEAFGLIIHLRLASTHPLQNQAIVRLSQFVSVREPNIRYLGLEMMSRIAALPGTLESIKRHQSTIKFSMKDEDISIRKRAVDLLYAMCDKTNCQSVIADLLDYLTSADFSMREELVLKIAILAEKFSPSKKFYVDVILKLITVSGDFVTQDIWHRVVQIVTNNEETQVYAAKTVYEALRAEHVHENAVKIGGYILGEFGHLLQEVSTEEQFEVLSAQFSTSSPSTKALLLSTYMKMANMNENLVDRVSKEFKKCRTDADSEIQQRACEYLAMSKHPDKELMNSVWETMPDFPDRESALEKKGRGKSRSTDEVKSNDSESEWSTSEESEASSESEEEEEEDAQESPQEGYEKPYWDTEDAARNGGTADSVHSSDGSDQDNSSYEDSDSAEYSAEETPRTAPTAKANTAQELNPPQLLDLGNMSSFGSTAISRVASSPVHAPVHAPSITQNMDLLSNVLFRSNGVLYESDVVEIGSRMRIENGHICKFILYYGNRNPREDLKNVECKVLSSVGLNIQIKPDETFSVGAKKQIPQHLMIYCVQPFETYPEVSIEYTMFGKVTSFVLKLPILASKFIQPWQCPMQEFVATWKQIDVSDEERFPFKSKTPIDVAKLRKDFEGLGMHVHPPMQNSPGTIVMSFTFHTANKRSDGEFLSFRVLIRLETNQKVNMFRATIRSEHRQVTAAFKYTLQQLFGAD